MTRSPAELAREVRDWISGPRREVDALPALAALAELEAQAEAGWAFVRLYDEVDKSQRLDNTGGDSAVSITLWGFAEARAAAVPSPADSREFIHPDALAGKPIPADDLARAEQLARERGWSEPSP